MRTRLVEVREGEKLGPIDWGFKFEYPWIGTGMDSDLVNTCTYNLKNIEKWLLERKKIHVWLYGIREAIVDCGMWDGFPHWKPTPSFAICGVFGSLEWHSWYHCRRVSYERPY